MTEITYVFKKNYNWTDETLKEAIKVLDDNDYINCDPYADGYPELVALLSDVRDYQKKKRLPLYGKVEHKKELHHSVMSDIEPYISTIDGSVIGSRSKHKKHLREHNCVEIGTESLDKAQGHFTGKEEREKEQAKQRHEHIVNHVKRAYGE